MGIFNNKKPQSNKQALERAQKSGTDRRAGRAWGGDSAGKYRVQTYRGGFQLLLDCRVKG